VPIIPAFQEAEIGKIMVKGSSGKKFARQLLNKLGVVVHVCNPYYTGSTGEDSGSRLPLGKNMRPYPKNN
jgi:hypothetical protein